MSKNSIGENSKLNNSRRDFMVSSGKVALATGMIGAAVGCDNAIQAEANKATPAIADSGSLKYSDNYWNRDTYAKLVGDLDFGKQRFGWFKGKAMGIRKNEKIQDLVGFEGFSFTRLQDLGNGVYQKLLREVGFYTDLKTGEVLENYVNPYTDEEVKVVHIANDPFNYKVGPFFPKPPAYGGLNPDDIPDIPFVLPWQEMPDGNVVLETGLHLFYKSALQPDKWPRESSGEFNQVSEMFRYVIRKEDLKNPNLTQIDYTGTWARITPWFPWLLMGQSEGHMTYMCTMGAYPTEAIDKVVSAPVLAYAKENYPKYFSAPEKYEEPSLSSLERYALEQKPAPKLKGGGA